MNDLRKKSNNKIRVLVADVHELMIIGLKHVISKNHDIEIVAATNDGHDALAKVAELIPDVVILSIDLPTISGIEVTERITKEHPEIKVILHTTHTDETNIISGFEAGAWSYIPKDFEAEELVNAIRAVHKGERYIKGIVSDIFLDSYFQTKKSKIINEQINKTLSRREIEILKLIADGLPHQGIADKLFLSIKTVNAHKYNMMKKLNISTPADLIKYALKNNLTTN